MIFSCETELFPVLPAPGCLRYELGTCLGPCTAGCSRKTYGQHARKARDFLAGNSNLLEVLEQDMRAAAAAQKFETAAILRDKLSALRWLTDRLRQQRLQSRQSFVYPVRSTAGGWIWYLIHGGRTAAAVSSPTDAASARRAAEAIEAAYQKKHSPYFLESYEHHDGRLIVVSWFRRYPRQRRRLLKPEQALDLCAGVLSPSSP
jgi:excinuclease ABC subunit C